VTTRRQAALAGVAAAAVALGVAELVGVLTGADTTPLIAVGAVVVDLVPEPVKHLAIEIFGTADKAALLVIIGAVLAALAALTGLAARRRGWYGAAGAAGLALLGSVAALSRPNASAAAALPSLAGGLAGAAAIVLMLRRTEAGGHPRDGTAGEAARESAAGRRRFLRTVAVLLGGAGTAAFAGRWFTQRRGVADARRAVTLPLPAAAQPEPAGADLRVPGLTPFVTPNRDFYRIDVSLIAPQVDPDTWRLRVHGRVRRPYSLSYADLLSRPMVERHVTLCCVSNEVGGDLAGNARWLGVPLAQLLAEADPEEGADQVVSRSVDGWTCGTPTAVLRDGRDALLAVGMNGQPLPVEHGFPARLVVPGLYGYVSATKWLAELELSSFADFDAYWVRRGWAREAPVKTQSRIDVPRSGSRVPTGRVVVAGVAWAQHRGIHRVEVQVDDGPWRAAALGGVPSVDTWRQWSLPWEATSGRHRLRVRATDGTGATQTERPAPPFPDGATGWHTIHVTVR
jgi:DMSO/TMAO reductase YedYZ molybdopterin-dependent catalytic subunit